MELNYYEILGVKKSANSEEIKAAFKSLAKKYHPDKNTGNKIYEDEFKKINEAYQILSNSSKRFIYDIKLESLNVTHQAYARPNSPKPVTKRKSKEEYLREKAIEKRIIWLTAIGLIVVLAFGYSLYLFMNQYTSNILLEEGMDFENSKAYVAALEKYSEAMGYKKENPEAYLRRGLLRVKCLGDIQGGLSDLTLAIKYSDEKEYNIFYKRAKIYLLAQQYKDALKDLNQTIVLKPDFDSAYFSQAEIENKFLGNCTDALLHYQRAIEINARFAEAYFGLGICFFRQKKITLALQELDKALALDKSKGEWYFYRGQCYLLQKSKNKACIDFAKALENGYNLAEKKIQKFCW